MRAARMNFCGAGLTCGAKILSSRLCRPGLRGPEEQASGLFLPSNGPAGPGSNSSVSIFKGKSAFWGKTMPVTGVKGKACCRRTEGIQYGTKMQVRRNGIFKSDNKAILLGTVNNAGNTLESQRIAWNGFFTPGHMCDAKVDTSLGYSGDLTAIAFNN